MADQFQDDPLRREKARIFTICSKNYLPYAKALIDSVRRHEPGADVAVVLADESDGAEAIAAYLRAPVILGSELGIPTYFDMAMRYDIVEFNTALKPFAFQHFFGNGADRVIYLDPDVELHGPMHEVWGAFASGAQGILTPHICQPLDMVRNPTELKLLRTGVYNLGFLALRRTDGAERFVSWWADRMPADCRVDLDAGIFVDQKYIDLMPSYLPDTTILRHPGYNVAYWNLVHRPLTKETDGTFRAAGESLCFMHFSGVRADQDDLVSVHQDRVSVRDLGEGEELFRAYRARLAENRRGLEAAGIDTSYAYGAFNSGEAIPPLAREVYARAVPPHRGSMAEIFDLASGPFHQGATGIDHENRHLISPVMADLWMRKPHLQAAFNIRRADEAAAFALWFAETGHKEWKIPRAFVPDAVWALHARRKSLGSRLALIAINAIEQGKRFAFLYPKPVRRAAVRFNRRVLPHLVKRMKVTER